MISNLGNKICRYEYFPMYGGKNSISDLEYVWSFKLTDQKAGWKEKLRIFYVSYYSKIWKWIFLLILLWEKKIPN